MAGSGTNWKWNPTKEQKKLFEEWKEFTIGYLVSSREGTNIRSISNNLEERTGEDIPLSKMGFRTINQFLYEMRDDIEVRTMDYKLFLFIKECAVPANLKHIRQMVLGQAKDKGCKNKRGVITRPSKGQTSFVRADQLLVPLRQGGSYSGYSYNTSYSAPRSNTMTPTAALSYSLPPPQPRIARLPPGLIEDESESDDFFSDDEGFDMYSGPSLAEMVNEKKKKEQLSQVVVTKITTPTPAAAAIGTRDGQPTSSKTASVSTAQPLLPVEKTEVEKKTDWDWDKPIAVPAASAIPTRAVGSSYTSSSSNVSSYFPGSRSDEKKSRVKTVNKIIKRLSANQTLQNVIDEPVTVAPRVVPAANSQLKDVASDYTSSESEAECTSKTSSLIKVPVATATAEQATSEKLKPMKGFTLDSQQVLSPIIGRKDPTIRMAFNLPDIKLPPFIRWGSGNYSLQAYLSSIGATY